MGVGPKAVIKYNMIIKSLLFLQPMELNFSQVDKGLCEFKGDRRPTDERVPPTPTNSSALSILIKPDKENARATWPLKRVKTSHLQLDRAVILGRAEVI